MVMTRTVKRNQLHLDVFSMPPPSTVTAEAGVAGVTAAHGAWLRKESTMTAAHAFHLPCLLLAHPVHDASSLESFLQLPQLVHRVESLVSMAELRSKIFNDKG